MTGAAPGLAQKSCIAQKYAACPEFGRFLKIISKR
jgi:hypothetical protein